MTEKKMSILAHLDDLRNVVIVSLLSLIPTTIIGWFIKERIYNLVLAPLLEINPNFQPIVLKPTDVFFVYMKISLAVGFALASPIIVWQIWRFVVPALKDNEKKVLRWVVPISIILFFVGIVFAYYTVFKVGVLFFYYFDQGTVAPMYGMREYWNFALSFLVPFGVVFELPVVMVVLTKLGVISPQWLVKNRKYAILTIVIAATIITPPDVISQLLMAGPMIILYEISILVARLLGRGKKVQEGEVTALIETAEENVLENSDHISEEQKEEAVKEKEKTGSKTTEEQLDEATLNNIDEPIQEDVDEPNHENLDTPKEQTPEKDYVVSDFEDFDYPVEKKREARLQSILEEIQNPNKNQEDK